GDGGEYEYAHREKDASWIKYIISEIFPYHGEKTVSDGKRSGSDFYIIISLIGSQINDEL
ncbi:MAG: hypothetical protein IJT56_11440, partial [Clostridia bacterium]|nr:hypothetical protein [Clostridia bacterium]